MSVDPMSYFNAKKGAQAQTNAANTAADATQKAAQLSVDASNKAYDASRADFQPFLSPSGRAMATLESAIYGGPQQYMDPNYRFDRETGKYININGAKVVPVPSTTGNLKPLRYIMPVARTAQNAVNSAGAKIGVDSPPMLSTTFNPQQSESYKWQKERGLADLGRILRMQGRGNSTAGLNATGRFLGDLNANEYQRQLDQLWNLVKTGQGAAGTVSGAGSSNAANNAAAYGMAGQGAANAAYMSGAAKANLYSGLSAANANAMGTGLQMANYFRNINSNNGGGGGGYTPSFGGGGYSGGYTDTDYMSNVG